MTFMGWIVSGGNKRRVKKSDLIELDIN